MGGRYADNNLSLSFSSASDQSLAERANLESLCEEAELLLEQDSVNKENRDPSPPPTRETKPPTHRGRILVKPTPRKPLRRPKPETIVKLEAADNKHHQREYEQSTSCTTDINPVHQEGKGRWLAAADFESQGATCAAPREHLYNPSQSQFAPGANWEHSYDQVYTHPHVSHPDSVQQTQSISDRPRPTPLNTDRSRPRPHDYEPPLNLYGQPSASAAIATDHSRGDSSGNVLRAGSYIVNRPHFDHHRQPEAEGCRPHSDSQRLVDRRRHYSEPHRSPQHHSYAPHPPRRRGGCRRIQDDDSWNSQQSSSSGESVLGRYRRIHEQTSPDNLHLSVRYVSPRKRLEDRIDSVCNEVDALRREVRDLNVPPPRRRPSVYEHRFSGYRW